MTVWLHPYSLSNKIVKKVFLVFESFLRGGVGYVIYTVKFLAPSCSSFTSTMFSEPIFRQTHTARNRLINMKDYPVQFQGTH